MSVPAVRNISPDEFERLSKYNDMKVKLTKKDNCKQK